MKAQSLKQPKVFNLAFSTATCERFGFYLLSWVLVLYIKYAYNLPDIIAYTVFGIFTGLCFLTPAIGGYLADNVFGIRRSMILGLALEGLGLSLLALGENSILPYALALIVVGVGFYKTTATHLLGRGYTKNDPRIDSGFTYFYMAINIGSVAAAASVGFIQIYLGWDIAFLIAGCSLFLGLLFYFIFKQYAKPLDSDVGKKKISLEIWVCIIIGIIITIFGAAFLLGHFRLTQYISYACGILLLAYFGCQTVKSSKIDGLKILACIMLMLIMIVFQIFYLQAYTSMELFIKRCVVRNIMGFNVPVTTLLAFNPFWILVIAPVLAHLYKTIHRKRGKNITITTKFLTGLFLISLCFLILKFSTFFPNANYKVSPYWIVIALFIYSIAELLIFALGVAMVTKISPKRYYGVMMGASFFAMSMGAILSSNLAALTDIPPTLHIASKILSIYGNAYFKMGLCGLGATVVAFFVAKYIRKIEQL